MRTILTVAKEHHPHPITLRPILKKHWKWKSQDFTKINPTYEARMASLSRCISTLEERRGLIKKVSEQPLRVCLTTEGLKVAHRLTGTPTRARPHWWARRQTLLDAADLDGFVVGSLNQLRRHEQWHEEDLDLLHGEDSQ
jgi:hypothetical protein